MIAPAYTRTWMIAMNSRVKEEDAGEREHRDTSHSAEVMAWDRAMVSTADRHHRHSGETPEKTLTAFIGHSPCGSAGSQSVETGWLWAHSRSRS